MFEDKKELFKDLMMGVRPKQLTTELCVAKRNFRLGRYGQCQRIPKANMKNITQIWVTFLFSSGTPNLYMSGLTMNQA